MDAIHQIHHSPQRLEVITSFYKHPLEMTVNSIIGSLLVYSFLGLNMEAGAIYPLCKALGDFFTIQILKLLNGLDIFSKDLKCIAYITNMKSIPITMEILFGGMCYLERIKTLKSSIAHVVSKPKKN